MTANDSEALQNWADKKRCREHFFAFSCWVGQKPSKSIIANSFLILSQIELTQYHLKVKQQNIFSIKTGIESSKNRLCYSWYFLNLLNRSHLKVKLPLSFLISYELAHHTSITLSVFVTVRARSTTLNHIDGSDQWLCSNLTYQLERSELVKVEIEWHSICNGNFSQ